MVSSVKEIKVLIDDVIIPGYSYKTNFSSSDYLIDINCSLIVKAKLVKKDNEMVYEFVLDTQFVSDKDLSYEELKMVVAIIDILENNRKFVLSRLKKYSVEEYETEQRLREEQSERLLDSLKAMIIKKYTGGEIYKESDYYE